MINHENTDSVISAQPIASGAETESQFESRKQDHIRLALDPRVQAGDAGFLQIQLNHEALPEIDFEDVGIETTALALAHRTPFFVSSMTAGHKDSLRVNLSLAKVAEARGRAKGVGSQRRQLFDLAAAAEWIEIRKSCRRLNLFGNIGLAQLIHTSTNEVAKLVESLEASAMIVHLNALQECMQPEGTPRFSGGLRAIEKLARELVVPVIIKETGCGFSSSTLRRLMGMGVAAVDVAGLGGTHWGRIEGGRSIDHSKLSRAAATFGNWGQSTVASLRAALELKPEYEIWASGGVRTGLDAAKLLAVGAQMVGVAQPLMAAVLKSETALSEEMERFEFELKVALFCTGCRSLDELREKEKWQWHKPLAID